MMGEVSNRKIMNQFGVRRIRRGVPGCTVRYVCGEVSFKKRKRAQSCLFDSAGIRVTVKKKKKTHCSILFFIFSALFGTQEKWHFSHFYTIFL